MHLEKKSKFLSYILRHKPEAAKLTLDPEGWCDIAELLANTDITLEELEQIVAEDSKQRYSIANARIRANQGHSTRSVNLVFQTAVPPVLLYHGTALNAAHAIGKEGLKPMNRHHVHLSADLDVAKSVAGRRKGSIVIFEVDAKQMLTDGLKFFISENGVWLVPAVPPKYLKEHV